MDDTTAALAAAGEVAKGLLYAHAESIYEPMARSRLESEREMAHAMALEVGEEEASADAALREAEARITALHARMVPVRPGPACRRRERHS